MDIHGRAIGSTTLRNWQALDMKRAGSAPEMASPAETFPAAYTLVDTHATLMDFLDSLDDVSTDPPSLYLDLEGDELSKDGTLTLISTLVLSRNHTYIIDVQILAEAAFNTTASSGATFKSVLESPNIPKAFFDVRNDSNALFFHHGIALQGVQDIQLMENASRLDFGRGNSFRKYVAGLAKCIERDAALQYKDLIAWKALKTKMSARFDATRGTAAIHVFAQRPLDAEALQYCAGDVQILPRLRGLYWARLTPAWRIKVEKETAQRVQLSQTVSYLPRGDHKARGPW